MNISKTGHYRRCRRILISIVLLLSSSTLTACSHIPFLSGSGVSKQVEGLVNPKGRKVTVWFVRTSGGELELASVERPRFGRDAVKDAVEQLLNGPDENEAASGVATEIPPGTILLGVKRDGDELIVDLSRRFSSGGGPTSFETRLEQLRKTVKGIDSDSKLFVNVEGERLTASSMDGLEIKQPI